MIYFVRLWVVNCIPSRSPACRLSGAVMMGIGFEDMLSYYTWIDLLMSGICISSYSERKLPILFGNESPLSGVRGLPMVMCPWPDRPKKESLPPRRF